MRNETRAALSGIVAASASIACASALVVVGYNRVHAPATSVELRTSDLKTISIDCNTGCVVSHNSGDVTVYPLSNAPAKASTMQIDPDDLEIVPAPPAVDDHRPKVLWQIPKGRR